MVACPNLRPPASQPPPPQPEAAAHLCQLPSSAAPACAPRCPSRRGRLPPRADRAPVPPAMRAVPGNRQEGPHRRAIRPTLEAGRPQPSSVFWSLLKNVPFLDRLELIGSNFSSAMPRNGPAIRSSCLPAAGRRRRGPAEVAAIGQLAFLRHLALAQLPSILTGLGGW